jgi:PAS domain S-box-containing protein
LQFDAALGDLSQEEIEWLCIRNLLASPDERIFFKDRDSRFVLVSAGMRTVVERQGAVGGVIGKSDLDFASAAHAAEARADEEHVMETGEPVAKVMHETFDDRPDEWAQTSRLPLREGTGEIVGTWGITHDITTMVAAQHARDVSRKQLRASEHMHRLMFDDNPQAMFLFDRHTLEYLAVNKAALGIYGYTREEFLTMSVTDLWEPEDIVANTEAIAAAPHGETQTAFIPAKARRHRYKDGTVVDVDIVSCDVMIDGRSCRLASSRDVTERNRASAELAAARDAAVEASNTKSAFLANISHEIRTPMNGVLGLTELLLDTTLDEDQRALAIQVTRSGELMLELINDILDISKIEAGQLELELVDYALRETIEQTCAVAGMQAGAKGLRFEVLIDDSVPELVCGDGRRLRQVLLNVVANAVKFTSGGSVVVRASAAARDGLDETLRIEVADTGIGIDPAAVERLFEPFTQADASTTRTHGGTGLGLAIARELAELMGGSIGVESELGAGSTFWVELPLAAPQEEPRGSAAGVAVGQLWSTPPYLLVAEDSAVNQIVAQRTLERCGCRADVVADGQAALDALGRNDYDAVLMDCQMPGTDGYQATTELRRRENGGRHLPVIAVTAHAMRGAREECLKAGMDDFLSKPIQREALIATLQRWLPEHVVAGAGAGNGTQAAA